MAEPALLEGAARLLDAAIEAGIGSAASLGVVAPDGERWRYDVGTLARVRSPGPEGVRRERLGPPVDSRTRYDLASLTKPVATSTLIAGLLSDPASPWTPGTPLGELLPGTAEGPLGALGVGALLSHASGLPAWFDYFEATAGLPAADRPAAVRRALLRTTPERPPGQAAVYSDLGFMLLGWALEQSLGVPLDEAFAERVAAPLGLESTGYRRLSARPEPDPQICATEVWPPRCPDGEPLCGVVHDDNAFALDGVAGHAGLFGTVGDLLIWAGQWLGVARGEDSAVLGIDAAVGRALLEHRGAPGTTWRAAFDTPSPGASSAGATACPRAFGHLGFTGTSVWIDPELGAVVLLTNRVHPGRDDLRIKALRPAVHEEIWAALRQRSGLSYGPERGCGAEADPDRASRKGI